MMRKNPTRRSVIAGTAALAAAPAALNAADPPAKKKVFRAGPAPATPPAYSPAVAYGNLLFVSGLVSRTPGDIRAHTETVLTALKQQLEAAGSSMEKVLRCTVYLADMKDFAAMNEIYTGRFGSEPPARSTVAVSGLPGGSLIELDAIAYI